MEFPHQVLVSSQEPDSAGLLHRVTSAHLGLALLQDPFLIQPLPRTSSELASDLLHFYSQMLTAPTHPCSPYLVQIQASENFPVFAVFSLLLSLSSKPL